MTKLENVEEILVKGGYTCVLMKETALFTSKQRGVKPLVDFYRSREDYSGFYAADKVVGKATAFLYLLLKVKAVYAFVISEGALRVLEDGGVFVKYNKLTKNIINRQGTGICPFENAVSAAKNENEAYELILNKMREMNIE